jgi:hypothetical protein
MRRQRGLAPLVYAASILALAAPARADTGVRGAGSFNDAPVLRSGTYSDTIRPEETDYYAIKLEPGQRLRVRVRLSPPSGTKGLLTFFGRVYDPLRHEAAPEVRLAGTGHPTFDLHSPTARQTSGVPPGSAFPGPGLWYVTINAENLFGRGQNPQRIEVPALITVSVIGAAQTDALPAVPAAKAPPPLRRAPVVVHESRGTDWGIVALIAAIALAVGAALGVAIAPRIRAGRR